MPPIAPPTESFLRLTVRGWYNDGPGVLTIFNDPYFQFTKIEAVSCEATAQVCLIWISKNTFFLRDRQIYGTRRVQARPFVLCHQWNLYIVTITVAVVGSFRPETVPFLFSWLLWYIVRWPWMLNRYIHTRANYRDTYPLKTHCWIRVNLHLCWLPE